MVPMAAVLDGNEGGVLFSLAKREFSINRHFATGITPHATKGMLAPLDPHLMGQHSAGGLDLENTAVKGLPSMRDGKHKS